MNSAPTAWQNSTVSPSNDWTSIRSAGAPVSAQRVADDPDPLVDREQRLLPRVGEHADDDLVERQSRPADDVEVAVRDRVEGARVDRDAHRSSSRR